MQPTPISYRSIRPEDEDAIFSLRMRTWGAPDIEYVRRNAYTDPLYLKHIFGAFTPDGTVLSTVAYWPRTIHDANALPRPVGCVAAVVTIDEARRQGHAARLIQIAHDTMRSEGCDWSFLFSSAMGVPLYQSLGYRLYPAPYYLGTLQLQQPLTDNPPPLPTQNTPYSVQRLNPSFNITDPNWQAIQHIYAAYNAHRPLSLVRSEHYWQNNFARRLVSAPHEDTTYIFLAFNNGQPVAYLLARLLSTESATHFFAIDQGLFIREAGSLPGHTAALQTLLSALRTQLLLNHTRSPQQPTNIPCAAFLPIEPSINEYMQSLLGPTLHLSSERRRTMALPLGKHFTESDLTAAFDAPGAQFWQTDNF